MTQSFWGEYKMREVGMTGRGRRRGTGLVLLLATASLGTALTPVLPAYAQVSASYSFAIPSQPLPAALAAFSRVTGLGIVGAAGLPDGLVSAPVDGTLDAESALTQLLAGTGLTGSVNGNTVTIGGGNAAAPVADGSILLDEVNVSAWGEGAGLTTQGVYETAGSVAHVEAAAIERFRGYSPASMFSGVPGVRSANASAGAGAIEVNVRGMQGFGRVNVKVDGAENQVTLYQGYQGISNRTFVDPDLVASMDVQKGPDVSSSGIAGTVAIRTVDASDIVKDGNTFGVKVKVTGAGNTSTPVPGAVGGYYMLNNLEGYPTVTPSATGLDRPNLLRPTQGSVSVIGAIETDDIDLIAAYAYRARGNYHAGTHGRDAQPELLGEQPFCYPSGECPYVYYDYVTNTGLSNYRAGEEVLNTELMTSSFITKATYRFGDGQSIKLGYTSYGSEAGDLIASRLGNDMARPTQNPATTDVSLDTITGQYKWQPDGNDLVDLTANVWGTWLEQRNPIRIRNYAYTFEQFGLPSDYKVGSDTMMWGGDISNRSLISDTGLGPLTLTYGASFKQEETEPAPYSGQLDAIVFRDGVRQEAAAFGQASWSPLDWLTLDAGLRYQHFWSEDRSSIAYQGDDETHGQTLEVGGFSPSLGLSVTPVEGVQLFANYANVMRSPSLFESLTGFSTYFNEELGPERATNWEIGTNLTADSLLADGDRAMLKLAYFNQDVSDYIARRWNTELVGSAGNTFSSMWVYNLHSAKFSGLELSGRYEVAGFTAELAANYYLGVEYCATADTCTDNTLYADFATNQVPPEYSIDLTLTQKLLDDQLTLGGRISHVGPRSIGHGEVTAVGQSSFINPVEWDPYTKVDAFVEYKITEEMTASLNIENVFDIYYVDPLGIVTQPAPGRTISASITGHF